MTRRGGCGYARLFQVAALAWMAVIFALSSMPSVPVPPLFWGQDKVFHMGVFGILGLLFAASIINADTKLSWRQVILVTIAVGLYGVSDEVHQMFVPGRSASLADVAADTLGGVLAALALRIGVLRRRRVLVPPPHRPGECEQNERQ